MSDSIVDALFLLNSEMSLRWTITLLHFLWQGCLIGFVATVVSFLLKNYAASLRYWLHAIAMLACPVCVAATLSLVTVPESLLGDRSVEIDSAVAFESSTGGVLPADVPYPALMPTDSITQPPVSPEMVPSPSGAVAARVVKTPTIGEATSSDVNADWYRMIVMWAMMGYVIGVACFLLRLSVALWGGHRLRANSVPLSDTALLALVSAQAQRIRLRIVPVVAYCERVAVPTVIGVLRPIVLLPASIVTGLTADEFSAIISHEFAHIRRYDLWMNLLQRLIESLLFFHPVVWFLSRRLGAEREVCCDDLVLRSGHEAMNYAGALLRMAELCAIPRCQNAAALTATGRSMSLLEHRIGRLINAQREPRLQLTRTGILSLALTILSLFAAPGIVRFLAETQRSQVTPNPTESGTATPSDEKHVAAPAEKLLVPGTDALISENIKPVPSPDNNGVYWSDHNQDGWMTGLKVQHWPDSEDAKLVVQYVLRNSGAIQQDIDIQYTTGPRQFMIDNQNRIDTRLPGIGSSSLRKLITVKPDEVVEDKTFLQEVDLTGLIPGQYLIQFDSMFFVPVADKPRQSTGMPFRLDLPLTLTQMPAPDEMPAKELTTGTAAEHPYGELPIHWGKPAQGLRMGAMFVDAPTDRNKSFATNDKACLLLFIQNVSKEVVSCQLLLPNLMSGWQLNIENAEGTHIGNKQLYISVGARLRVLAADLAPDEIQPMTGTRHKFREANEDAGDSPEIELAEFLIAPEFPERAEYKRVHPPIGGRD